MKKAILVGLLCLLPWVAPAQSPATKTEGFVQFKNQGAEIPKAPTGTYRLYVTGGNLRVMRPDGTSVFIGPISSNPDFGSVSASTLTLQGETSGVGFVDLPSGDERDTPASGYLRLFSNGGDLQFKTSGGTVYTLTNPVRNQFQFVQGGSLALDGYVQGQRGNFGNFAGLYFTVDRAATVNAPATEDSNASVQITAPTSGKKPLILQLKSGQTANGFEVQDSTGAVLASFDASGNVTAKNIKRGTGSPEGSVVGIVGDLYTRTDGGTGTTLYVKESGTGNTGWAAK